MPALVKLFANAYPSPSAMQLSRQFFVTTLPQSAAWLSS
jgi:hypothetical protein